MVLRQGGKGHAKNSINREIGRFRRSRNRNCTGSEIQNASVAVISVFHTALCFHTTVDERILKELRSIRDR